MEKAESAIISMCSWSSVVKISNRALIADTTVDSETIGGDAKGFLRANVRIARVRQGRKFLET